MKLPTLSRSRSNSPPSATSSSPKNGSQLSPSASREKKSGRLCSPLPDPLSSIRQHESFSDINKLTTDSSEYVSRANLPSLNRLTSSSSEHDGNASTKASLQRIPSSILQEIKQSFAQFDTNGDGKISADELRAMLRSLGDETTWEEAALILDEVDGDGDGFIDFQEFVDLNTRCLHMTGEIASHDELTAAFDIFDLDKNGHITAEELHKVLTNLGDHDCTLDDCALMIRSVDRKGAGHVDFDDFKLMLTRA